MEVPHSYLWNSIRASSRFRCKYGSSHENCDNREKYCLDLSTWRSLKSKLDNKKGLRAHYLSPESQNEFITTCAVNVRRYVLDERESAKYYSIMADSTPDASHIEQTTHILRYLVRVNEGFIVQKRFLALLVDGIKRGSRSPT
ncbi:hypothetical protein LOD99_9902 [Oopsacas minuta]|uniref:DUF4371 domain-containing protein n=1 Tax=Oopsacas minuta TaxID=111878 RepID=A0AAV7KLC6_9METZ|nr:hypothetical protein LOD99_9902 [Oopsacas minuta]